MIVGVLPLHNQYKYSSACRAFPLVKNLEYCELYQETKKYDIVILQKIFDLNLIKDIQKKGSICIIDSCDSYLIGPSSLYENMKNCFNLSNAITVPTYYLQQKIIKEINSNKVFIGPDIMEFDYRKPLVEKNNKKVAVIYGTFHNLSSAKNISNILYGFFDKIIFITDRDHHLNQLISIIGKRDKFEFVGWDQNSVFDIIGSSTVSIILYRNATDALYKSCNRTLISLFCGTPVVSFYNPEVKSLQEKLTKYIHLIHSENVVDVMPNLIQEFLNLELKDREKMREFGKKCEYGMENALKKWDFILKYIQKNRNYL